MVKGKGKGKGKAKSDIGPCHHCGKMGHLVRDCWQKDAEMDALRASNSTGNGPFGKGESKGKGSAGDYQSKGYGKSGGRQQKGWQHSGGKGSYGKGGKGGGLPKKIASMIARDAAWNEARPQPGDQEHQDNQEHIEKQANQRNPGNHKQDFPIDDLHQEESCAVDLHNTDSTMYMCM